MCAMKKNKLTYVDVLEVDVSKFFVIALMQKTRPYGKENQNIRFDVNILVIFS